MRTLLVALVLTSSSAAMAISPFQQEVPNGTVFRCLTCHVRAGGGEPWNDFGQAVLIVGGANPAANPEDQNDGFGGSPDWAAVCGDDSDGDGSTNGEELGDPDCIWASGDPSPDEPEGGASNPGDAASVPGDPGDPDLPGSGGGADELGGCGGVSAASALLLLAPLSVRSLRRRRRST